MMIRQWFIGIAAVCSLWGCSRSTMNDTPAQTPSNEGKMGVTLEFSSDSPLRAPSKNTTKATATESMTDETLVSNMVVLQYDMRNEEGQLVGVQYVDGVSQSGSNVQVSVSLEPLRKTRVVVLANMTGYFDSESVALGSSLEELNRLTFPIASTDGTGIPNDYNTALPMRAESGDITLTEGQVDQLNLTLYRLVAKVEFLLHNFCLDTEAEKYFEVTNVTLKNVPKMGSYERVTETNYVDEQFPLRDAENFTKYTSLAGAKFTGQTTSCIWYMAPNNGGISEGNTSNLDKMDPTKVPSNFCTYVEIAGTIYISGTAHPVTYRLYLGGDELTDYNIWANEAYTVSLYIRSLPDNPEDMPDGNFKGFRISMQSSEMHSMSVTGWELGIQNVSVSPTPKTISHTGGEYLITMTGTESWGDPVPVRIWDGSEAVAQGRVAYDQYQEGGNITFSIPENKTKVTRSLSFQFQWDGTWITFDNGTQFSTALESIGVTPDPLNIPTLGETYTITFNGLWGDDIPVRLWNITTDSEIASDAVSYNGDHSIDLKVPENATRQTYTIDFQYQWEGVWASIRTGAQYPEPYVTKASVSPDPTLIENKGGDYTITLAAGAWNSGTIPVRVVSQGQELLRGSITYDAVEDGGHTTLTIPVNENEALRDLTFQYQEPDPEQWVNIQSGQQQGQQIDFGANFILQTPDPNKQMPWKEAIEYCKSLGTGWRLPTQNELLLLWCIYPSLSEEEKFHTENDNSYWSCTEYLGNPNNEVWFAMFKMGDILYPSINTWHNFKVKTYEYVNVRCVKSKPEAEISQRYPAITSTNDGGAIVVLREGSSGFVESTLYQQKQTRTNTGALTSDGNRMSRKFRIAAKGSSANWANAIKYCDELTDNGYDDWRVPSQRETMLLWILGANTRSPYGDKNNSNVGGSSMRISEKYLYQLPEFEQFIQNYYYTAQPSPYTSQCMQFDFNVGLGGSFGQQVTRQVRCIRDEW